MAYCTTDDLLEKIELAELIAITDEADAGVVDQNKTDRAIADADAEIDAYCGRLYQVPLDPVPAMIRKQCVAIAIYNLFQGKHGAPEDRRTDYEDAVKFLKAVRKGDISLGIQPEPAAPTQDTAAATKISARNKIFSTETMEKY